MRLHGLVQPQVMSPGHRGNWKMEQHIVYNSNLASDGDSSVVTWGVCPFGAGGETCKSPVDLNPGKGEHPALRCPGRKPSTSHEVMKSHIIVNCLRRD